MVGWVGQHQVSRYYGGVHLGPDRFRHFNNVARELLDSNGFGKQHQEGSGGGSGGGHKKKKKK